MKTVRNDIQVCQGTELQSQLVRSNQIAFSAVSTYEFHRVSGGQGLDPYVEAESKGERVQWHIWDI